MRGVRFIASEYNMSSDNLLLDGVDYTIKVPVFNASFKTATNFNVRLSYSEAKKDQIAPTYDAPRTTVGSPVYDRNQFEDAPTQTGTLNTNGGGEEQDTPTIYFSPSGVNASANDASVFPFIEFVSADGLSF